MHPSRQYKVPNVTQSPRTSLPLHLHPAVDGALKELKSAHRRLHVACAEFGRELQILNKLYYKGYNQHRLALFWKRTAEIRKYARRVDDADIASIADVLRRSFFGPEAQVNPKMLRGSWTHLPDRDSLLSLLKRASDYRQLLDKTHERFVNAYQHLNIAMQTGAFIQLLVVLAAVVSRMDILVEEITDALELMRKSGREVMNVIDPASATETRSTHSMPGGNDVPTTTSSIEQTDVTDEDLGDVLSRPSILAWQDNPPPLDPNQALLSVYQDTGVVSITRTVVTVASNEAAASPPDPPRQQKAKKPRRTKRDEIDDIFGFM
ncbi:hypothetical protein PC9H_000808 [Pleurotus ostreatus]|uniref:Uncharacterized protein n=2 Tax=Pleurotus ostreatus TaxID=5322 RepID=A0A067PBK7_PLEO1|nr:uncharacterized protein PC9H_000808 [Pleurotus ostreatus]KAF7440463.1 hypothetical protein PC9H_000808 [Pleurotus ostreatus]KDQ33256.1 hypothetical protein PLEOSDRAFT_1099230 [Pleurotus ostreatus PC15]